jgi:hypothetical protein
MKLALKCFQIVHALEVDLLCAKRPDRHRRTLLDRAARRFLAAKGGTFRARSWRRSRVTIFNLFSQLLVSNARS